MFSSSAYCSRRTMFKRLTIPSAGMELLGNTTRVLHFSMTEYRLEKLVALGFPIPSFTRDPPAPRPPGPLLFDSCRSFKLCLSPRQESNPHYELRKLASYPLNDEGA